MNQWPDGDLDPPHAEAPALTHTHQRDVFDRDGGSVPPARREDPWQ
jgi:hypothetical protein